MSRSTPSCRDCRTEREFDFYPAQMGAFCWVILFFRFGRDAQREHLVRRGCCEPGFQP